MGRTTTSIFSIALAAIAAAQDTTTLQPGKPIERQLAGRETHSYPLLLNAGDFLRAVFDQRGIDIVVTAYGPDQLKLVEVNANAQGRESLEMTAAVAGTYRIEVGAVKNDARAGRYQASIDALMTAEEFAAERTLEEQAASEIARILIPIRTPEAGHGFDDLEALRRVVGNARVVALGEATHGTREFFQLKHRVLEYLVTQMGFNVFAIEASLPEAFGLNEYVMTGKGDPKKALSSFWYFAWDTEEVLELIEWMRRYNAGPTHRTKVKFYGFDMSSPVRAAKVTFDYLKNVEEKVAPEWTSGLELLANPMTQADFFGLAEEQKQATLAASQAILARFDERKSDYVKKSSRSAWSIARQHARVLAQNLDERVNDPARTTVRPRSMANNIDWILQHEGPRAKVVVWAHNNHVATEGTTMGSHLRKLLGRRMRTIGFAFNQGSFQANEPGIGLRSFTVPPAPAGSFDALLAKANIPVALIDFHSLATDSPVRKWLGKPRATYDMGGTYRDADVGRVLVKRNLPARYDALFFVEKTTAARANPYARIVNTSTLPRHAEPANPDFEEQEADRSPKHWIVLPPTPEKYDVEVTTSGEAHSGKRSGLIRRRAGKHYSDAGGSILQWVDAKAYRGKTVRLRLTVKSRGETNRTFVWMKVYGAFEERRETTNGDWKQYELIRDIPSNAVVIEIGMGLTGDGESWIDAVSLEVVEPA